MEAIKDPIRFVSELGGMHDVRIAKIGFDVRRREVVFDIDDLNANFRDPDDSLPACRSCILTFRGVSEFNLELAADAGGVRIDFARMNSEGGLFRLAIDLSEGGPSHRVWTKCLSIFFSEMFVDDLHEKPLLDLPA